MLQLRKALRNVGRIGAFGMTIGLMCLARGGSTKSLSKRVTKKTQPRYHLGLTPNFSSN
jgi:hypothetical protein